MDRAKALRLLDIAIHRHRRINHEEEAVRAAADELVQTCYGGDHDAMVAAQSAFDASLDALLIDRNAA